MAGLATQMFKSSRLLSMVGSRSLCVGGTMRSEVQAVGTVPAHVTEKFAGAKPEVMAFVTEGYAKLTADEKDLVNKVAGPWGALTIQEKQALYDLRYEQSKYEEDEEQNTSHYFKYGSLIWLVNAIMISWNVFQNEYNSTSGCGTPTFCREKTPEWEAAVEYRYAKYDPNPITRNLGGFR